MHPLLGHLSFQERIGRVAAYSYEYSYPYEDYNGDNQISNMTKISILVTKTFQ